ncbi:MAG: HAD-IC family P-type ATPase [Coriobacteriia bacterium]|nr:HAD-IC family P-type ATPase [Coriobacteriia bacterium]
MQNKGLTQAEVQKRINAGKSNVDASVKSRSIKRICYDNIFTLFNAVNVILAIIVALTGSYKNMLFMGVIICNTLIGIIQEIRSKRTTDKLTIVAEAKVKVIRDGKLSEIPIDQIVVDDVIQLGRGDQVPTDCVVLSGTCDANESLLTGESDLIPKAKDAKLMSGSFINAGKVECKVVHVGADNYAAKITAEAKAHKVVNSQIMETMNGLIKIVSMIIFPLGAVLFCKAYFLNSIELIPAVLTTVSAMIGMIPEGLILLTSTVLAVSVVRLSKYKVLVQQLYCIETLARVDTLCLDKTGTITSGKMEVEKTVGDVDTGFASLVAADEDKNETSLAIEEYYKDKDIDVLKATRVIPFSSDKKYSGAMFGNFGYVMGATQFITNDKKALSKTEELAVDARVLLLAKVRDFDDKGNIVGDPEPIGFICVRDQIRDTAAQTIKYFADEGVQLKVISGDDPRTVSGIARQVGVAGAENFVDATTLKTDADIEEAINKYSVFGRVKPEQKKAFVVALQKHGHTVAMTGDGVNDVLSLKQADCSVAMASGSSAARNVAHLVLINNDFASMTQVVAEGRRSINNLQRSASLFLVKTLLSMGLAAIFLFMPWSYPFQPIQLTLISAFTIGVPSFVLALEPNHDRIKGHFLINVIVRSIPSAVVIILAIVALNVVGYNVYGLNYEQVSTMCVLMMSTIGFMLIIRLSIPFTPIRAGLIIVVVGGTILGCVFFGDLFNIAAFNENMISLFVSIAAIGCICFFIFYQLLDKWYSKAQAKLV